MLPKSTYLLICFLGCCVLPLLAQQPTGTTTATSDQAVVPPVVNFGGILTDQNNKPLSGTLGVTFSLYRDEQGGSPLWLETQNVQADKTGHYSVVLGSTTSHGIPSALFTAGEARWLGVQAQGQPEQPRVLLMSVPYAMKAVDAQTIAGLPPSAFVRAAPPGGTSDDEGATSTTVNSKNSVHPSLSGNGTANYLPLWTDSSTLGNSVLYQTGTGSSTKVGINTTNPSSTLDVKGATTVRGLFSLPAAGTATSSKGYNSQGDRMTASAFNSGSGTAVAQNFQWLVEPAGNNTSNPSGTLNLLFSQGTNKLAETGLNVSSNGLITFATGQSFPGTGTITGITTASGSGLVGGGGSGNLSLSLLNNCGGGQVLQWNGGAWACASVSGGTVTSVGSGLGLTGGPITKSGTLSIDTSVVPQLNTANTFTGNQTVNGNLSATGLVAGSAFNLGSNLFAYGNYNNQNAFLGFAGNTSMTGTTNTATGYGALKANTTGGSNTAAGLLSLSANTSGQWNTGIGTGALQYNTTGSNNTAIGIGSGPDSSSPGLTNATAIGANAVVSESNALALGGTGQYAVNVGIGTAKPAATLHVVANNYHSIQVDAPQPYITLNTSTTYQSGIQFQAKGINKWSIFTDVGGNSINNLSFTDNAAGATRLFIDNAGNVGVGTTTPSSTLDVHGTANFAGLVNFASGQQFPGAGTITGVTAGMDLTGGGSGGNVTLNLDTSKVPQLAAQNYFTNAQTVSSTGDGLDLYPGSNGYGIYAYGPYVGIGAFDFAYPVFAATTSGAEGVMSENGNTTPGSMGVYGLTYGSSSGQLYGLFGNNAGSNLGAGVYGQNATSGARSSTGSNWTGTGAGIWGDGGTTGNFGLFASTDNFVAARADNNASYYYTLVAYNHNTSGYPFYAYNAGGKGCTIDSNGSINCTGSKNAVVPIDGGQRKVALSAIESPKNWFEDFGSAHLSNGAAVVRLESEFAQTVNTNMEYHVFLTPNGDCKGLYVSQRTPASFEVHEIGGGIANIEFSYRIVALRKNFENVRLADHTNDPDPQKTTAQGVPTPFNSAMVKTPERPATKLRPATHTLNSVPKLK